MARILNSRTTHEILEILKSPGLVRMGADNEREQMTLLAWYVLGPAFSTEKLIVEQINTSQSQGCISETSN